MRSGWIALSSLFFVAAGCSAASPSVDAGSDRPDVGTAADVGTVVDAGSDAAPVDDAGADGGPRDDASVPGDAGCVPTTCTLLGAHCGSLDDGCGILLDCGSCESAASCVDGTCACGADTHEPDDVATSAGDGGMYTDADADIVVDGRWLHTSSDVDWVRYTIRDTATDSLTALSAVVAAPGSGSYEVAVFYECDAGTNASSCDQGTSDDSIGRGCVATTSGTTGATVSLAIDCQGTLDDSGTLYVRVRSTGATPCTPYELTTQIR